MMMSYEEYLQTTNQKDSRWAWKQWKIEICGMSEREAIRASIQCYEPLEANHMNIEFNAALKKRTIAFCKDELNYHINESRYADEYHDEICAEIELLYRLGETSNAKRYRDDYISYLSDEIECGRDKELMAFRREVKKIWERLTESES